MKVNPKFAFLMVVIFGVSLIVPVMAQQAPAALSIWVNDVDIDAFPEEVVCSVTVRDVNGVPVFDLDKDAFEVNEDRAPQARPIVGFDSQINPDQPLELVILLDISGSMAGQPLANAKAAIEKLVQGMGDRDRIALIAFSDAIDLDAVDPEREIPLTDDRDAVLALVDGFAARGGTPLYDALYKGVLWAEEALVGHRAIIILTDGVDEYPGSRVASAETPIQQALVSNVPIFAIGLGRSIDRGYLMRVSRTTGGIYQETPDSEQLTELFVNVQEWFKQQYVITYSSGLLKDGEVHRVQVNVEERGRTASAEVSMGPLPAPDPTPTPIPTFTPSPTPMPTSTPTPSSPAPSSESQGFLGQAGAWVGGAASSFWAWLMRWIFWLLLGLLFLVILVVAFLTLFRSAQDKVMAQEFCAICERPLNPDEICLTCGPGAGRVHYVAETSSVQQPAEVQS